jgi:phospholipid-binding lipoprotein MlaA
VNYFISSLLLFLTCVSGFAQPGTPPNGNGTNSAPKKPENTTGTSSADELANAPAQKVNDPFERINRSMFHLNDSFTTHTLQPIVHGYERVLPRPVRTSISNFFDNLDFPIRFGNDVLQGRIVRSGQEVGKFVINSTAGVGGLFRVSDQVQGLADVPGEDFGLTLGRWGLPTGPYLVVPLIGPSNFRDLTGYAGDYVMNPLNWYQIGIINEKFISNAANWAIAGSKFVARLPANVDTYEQMKESAIDPYIAVRNAYLSHRAAQLEK